MDATVCPYSDGTVLRCGDTGAIYKIEGGAVRYYPNMPAYEFDGSPAWSSNNVCNMPDQCPWGADMPIPADGGGTASGGGGDDWLSGVAGAAKGVWDWVTSLFG